MLGGPVEPPLKTLAVLHHTHRAQMPRISAMQWNLTLLILSWYAGLTQLLSEPTRKTDLLDVALCDVHHAKANVLSNVAHHALV